MTEPEPHEGSEPGTSPGLLFDDPTFDTDVDGAAALLEVGRTRLSQMVARGELSCVKRKVGSRLRMFFRRSELMARVASRYRHSFAAHAGLRPQSPGAPAPLTPKNMNTTEKVQTALPTNTTSDPILEPTRPLLLPKSSSRKRNPCPTAAGIDVAKTRDCVQQDILTRLEEVSCRVLALEELLGRMLLENEQRHLNQRLLHEHVLKVLNRIEASTKQHQACPIVFQNDHTMGACSEQTASKHKPDSGVHRRRQMTRRPAARSVVIVKPKKSARVGKSR